MGMVEAVKIRTCTVSKIGRRGFRCTLPSEWVRDMRLEKKGSSVDIYRDVEGRLIIMPAVRKRSNVGGER